jgi:release factor glutamine methyltransferase
MNQREFVLTIAQAISEGAQVLQAAGVAAARREAGSLLAHVISRDRTYLITHGDEKLSPTEAAAFRQKIARRAAGEPFQYISGSQEFFGLDFEVTPDVLIPRPETELLVETALVLLQGTNRSFICDIGTGSGCISIALLKNLAAAHAIGVDIWPPALSVAQRNAARHGVGSRLALVAGDCFAAFRPEAARFTMIVSNPPYVDESDLDGLQREVRDFEPRVALTPGRDGLSVIRRLLIDAPAYLVPGGHLLFEIGYRQHEAVGRLVDTRVWTLLAIHKDLQGIPRAVALRRR